MVMVVVCVIILKEPPKRSVSCVCWMVTTKILFVQSHQYLTIYFLKIDQKICSCGSSITVQKVRVKVLFPPILPSFDTPTPWGSSLLFPVYPYRISYVTFQCFFLQMQIHMFLFSPFTHKWNTFCSVCTLLPPPTNNVSRISFHINKQRASSFSPEILLRCNTCSKVHIFLRIQHDDFLHMATSMQPSSPSRRGAPGLCVPLHVNTPTPRQPLFLFLSLLISFT